MTSDELSGFAIIISFAIGLMAFVVLFIFAKRQITRFSLKSRRGPHQTIGLNAHKSLRKEIDRRLDAVKEIKYEPKILDHSDKRCQNNQNYPHYWRMRAVDQLELLQECIDRACPKDPEYRRPPRQDLRLYLLKMAKDGGPLHGCETRLIHQFVDAYVHAKHEPTPDFNEQEYNNYMNLLNKLRNYVRRVNSLKSSNIEPDDEKKPDKDEDKSKDTTQPELNGQTRLRLMNLTLPDVRDEPKSETRV